MKVSLLLTSKNEEKHVPQFFECIKKQTRKPDEIILVDSSTDSTAKMSEEYLDLFKLRYNIDYNILVKETNNCGHGRAIGFHMTTGKIIVLTDLDALLKNNWLEELVKPFSNSDVHVVQGQVLFYSLDKEENQMWSKGLLEKGKYTNHCNIAFRRHVIEEHPWDPMINLDDVEMGYKIKGKYAVYGQKTAIVQHLATPEYRPSFRKILKYHIGYWQLIIKYKKDAPYWWARMWYNILYLIPKGQLRHFTKCIFAIGLGMYYYLNNKIE